MEMMIGIEMIIKATFHMTRDNNSELGDNPEENQISTQKAKCEDQSDSDDEYLTDSNYGLNDFDTSEVTPQSQTSEHNVGQDHDVNGEQHLDLTQ